MYDPISVELNKQRHMKIGVYVWLFFCHTVQIDWVYFLIFDGEDQLKKLNYQYSQNNGLMFKIFTPNTCKGQEQPTCCHKNLEWAPECAV